MPEVNNRPGPGDAISGHQNAPGEANTSSDKAPGDSAGTGKEKILKLLGKNKPSPGDAISGHQNAPGEANTSSDKAPGGPAKVFTKRNFLKAFGLGAAALTLKAVEDNTRIVGRTVDAGVGFYNKVIKGQDVIQTTKEQISEQDQLLSRYLEAMAPTPDKPFPTLPLDTYKRLADNPYKEYFGFMDGKTDIDLTGVVDQESVAEANNELNGIRKGLGALAEIYVSLAKEDNINRLVDKLKNVSPDKRFVVIDRLRVYIKSLKDQNKVYDTKAFLNFLADRSGFGLGWGMAGVLFINDLASTTSWGNGQPNVMGSKFTEILNKDLYRNAFLTSE